MSDSKEVSAAMFGARYNYRRHCKGNMASKNFVVDETFSREKTCQMVGPGSSCYSDDGEDALAKLAAFRPNRS